MRPPDSPLLALAALVLGGIAVAPLLSLQAETAPSEGSAQAPSTGPADAPGVRWLADLDTATALAAESDRPLLIVFR